MASLTSSRPRVDQENSQQAFNTKGGGTQGRGFGPTKTFQSNTSNAPLSTPRRALGDVGNTFKTPGNLTKKASLLKPSQSKLAKTPGAKKITQATPLGKGLSKQNGSLSVRTNKKQAFNIRGDSGVETENKSSSLEKECYKKEKMFPFVDDEPPLPRSPAVTSLLQNVSQFYRGCMQPVIKSTFCRDDGPKLDLDIEIFSRPETDVPFNWLEFDTDFSELTSELPINLDDVELPPVDTDLSGMGLP